MKTSQYVSFFVLSAIAAGAIIAGLSTLWWVSTYQSSTILGVTTTRETNWGMRQYQVKINDGDRQTYDYDDNYERQDAYIKAGKAAISMGSFALGALAIGVVSVALLKLCNTWTGGRARFLGMLCTAVATALIIAGTITFTQTIPSFDSDLDEKFNWSFGLYVGGGGLCALIFLGLGCSKY